MSILYIYICLCVCIYEFRLGISSDFISGFCGESEEEHADNLSLIRSVGFDQAFTYRLAAIPLYLHTHIKTILAYA